MSKVEDEIMNFLECYDFRPKKDEEAQILINLDPSSKKCNFCNQKFIEADKNLLFYRLIYSYYKHNYMYEYEDVCVICTCKYIRDDLSKSARPSYRRYVSLTNGNSYTHYDVLYHIYTFVQNPQNALVH